MSKVTAISGLATPAVILLLASVVAWFGTHEKAFLQAAEPYAPSGSVTFVVSGPGEGGQVILAGASLSHAATTLRVTRLNLTTGETAEVAKSLVSQATDRPSSGSMYRYSLMHGETTLASHEIDLRQAAQVRFRGGTAKHGVFEYLEPGLPGVRFVCGVGEALDVTALKEDGSPLVVETGWILESIRLEIAPAGTRTAISMATPDGTKVLGLDSKPIEVKSLKADSGLAKVFVAVMRHAATGRTLKVAENEKMAPSRP